MKTLIAIILAVVIYQGQPMGLIQQEDSSDNIIMLNPHTGEKWGGSRNSGSIYLVPINPDINDLLGSTVKPKKCQEE